MMLRALPESDVCSALVRHHARMDYILKLLDVP